MVLAKQDIIDILLEPFVILDEGLRIVDANQSFYKCFLVGREETVGRMLFDLGNGQWDIPQLREALNHIMTDGPRLSDFEVTHDFPNIGRRVTLLNGRRVRRDHLPEPRDRILLAIEDVTRRVIQFNVRDITPRRQGEEELQTSQDHLEAELSATRQLHETSSQLMSEGDTGAIYENILDTAMALMHSDSPFCRC